MFPLVSGLEEVVQNLDVIVNALVFSRNADFIQFFYQLISSQAMLCVSLLLFGAVNKEKSEPHRRVIRFGFFQFSRNNQFVPI